LALTPSQSVDNRSLVRGLEILRAFRPGIDLLTNSELAERTGLPRSTISRLTGTLVRCGFLQHDARVGGYRLHATVLGLAHAMRAGSLILNESLEAMQQVGRQLRVNIGLALADQDDMMYLDTLRFGPKASLRKVVSGQRVPIALTSLGRAYLSTHEGAELTALLARLEQRHARDWPQIRQEIEQAISDVRTTGFCITSWQPQVVALSTPMVFKDHPVHVLNMSLFTEQSIDAVRDTLAPALLRLRKTIMTRIESAHRS